MRRLTLLALLALLLAAASATALRAATTYPPPQGFVSDFGGMLSASARSEMEAELTAFEQQTGIQIAVVTVASLDGGSIEDYAVRLFEQWQIGKKGQDNGVLFLISRDDRRFRIEVGYGMEPLLTDARAGDILRNVVTPRFQTNDYDGGIRAGVAQIKAIAAAEPPSSDPLARNPVRRNLEQYSVLFIILAFASIYVMGYMARSKSVWLGGIWGAGMGVLLGLILGSLIVLGVAVALSAALGLLLDLVLSRNYKALSGSGRSTGWGPTRGGFWGGGGGGFGGGGGGFGGFGGGGSGGGGSSGGW